MNTWTVIVTIITMCMVGCNQSITYQTIAGQTWTTYTVKAQISTSRTEQLKKSIDSLLADIDQSVSTYIDSSEVSRFNTSSSKIDTLEISKRSMPNNDHFLSNLILSKKAVLHTDAYFDPTVFPLVEYYGFGKNKVGTPEIDSVKIDSIHLSVEFHKVFKFTGHHGEWCVENVPDVQLDFSAIAKGYMVDQVAELLEKKGQENYMVEIGGEVRAKGINDNEHPWNIAIEQPLEDSAQGENIHAIIPLSDESMATSGNYRNHKIINGQKVVHTINPKTGYPEISNLLSATIITNRCAYADAYATACMVMGLEKSKDWIEATTDIEGFLIFSNEKGEFESWASSGIRDRIVYLN